MESTQAPRTEKRGPRAGGGDASSGGAGEELGFSAGPAHTSRGGQAADGMLRLRADRPAVALSALVPSSRGVCISASPAFPCLCRRAMLWTDAFFTANGSKQFNVSMVVVHFVP